MNVPFTKQTLNNGLDVIVHEDHRMPLVAVSVWYHVGSKNERPDRTGLAHLFEHLMFEGLGAPAAQYFEPLAGSGRLAQRIDEHRSHQLLGAGAGRRAAAGAVDGSGSDGLAAAGAHRRELRDAARRRAERAASELREPAVWAGAVRDHGGDLSAGSSVPLAHDWRSRRSARGVARRRPARFSRGTTIRATRRS